MKVILSKIATNSLSLFLVSLLFSGLSISGGFVSFLIAGALLAVFSILLDPIVKIVTLPFNLLTLGFLSFLTTLASLFVLTIAVSDVRVSSFTFQGLSFMGIQIGQIYLSYLLSLIVISATIYIANRLIAWLFS